MVEELHVTVNVLSKQQKERQRKSMLQTIYTDTQKHSAWSVRSIIHYTW